MMMSLGEFCFRWGPKRKAPDSGPLHVHAYVKAIVIHQLYRVNTLKLSCETILSSSRMCNVS